ncbi:MAG TPA: hypothetical protein VKX49_20465 [Bryobacteraceae bacterium]|nr:hypothetical protein [Bryobacteraceae bacterium]
MPQRSQLDSLASTARNRLAALSEKKPRSMAAQLRLLWPEIRAALDRGHTLKAVCECLEGDGLKMSIYTLGSYVARMRRSSATVPAAPARSESPHPSVIAGESSDGKNEQADRSLDEKNRTDPLANLRKSQAKRPAFDYRPELADADKLI